MAIDRSGHGVPKLAKPSIGDDPKLVAHRPEWAHRVARRSRGSGQRVLVLDDLWHHHHCASARTVESIAS
jgi:hypothetical protein